MRLTLVAIALAVIGISPPAALVAQHASPPPAEGAHPSPAAPAPGPEATTAPPAADAHGHTTPLAAKPTIQKKNTADSDMAGVIERIQQRIAAEVGTGAAPAARARPSAGVHAAVPAPAPAAPAIPRVTLNWRTTLTWPPELLPAAPLPDLPLDPVQLIWR